MRKFTPNSLYYGDCLHWMNKWEDECVDLIYLDPPFNSNANYNVLFKNGNANSSQKAQYRAFTDTWRWDGPAIIRYNSFKDAAGKPGRDCIVGLYYMLGECGMLAYLTYMADRLIEMRRLLKTKGSIFLHCDPTASHYLKTVMDAIFGKENFRNEIVWGYRGGGVSKRGFARKHDTIFFYNKKADAAHYNPQYVPYSEASERLVSSKGGISIDGKERDLDRGAHMPDWWMDINSLQTWSPERLGYRTQKPLPLLERIIKASSNEGDIVLDPFCGCGTAIEASMRLNRRWAGIDISSFAIDLIRKVRLKDESIPAFGMPADMDSAEKLAKEKPFDFESWSVTRLPGFAPNTRQVADGGVDGRATLNSKPDNYDSRLALAQVKGGRFSLSGFRDFAGVIDRDKAALGYFITLNPVNSAGAKREAANRKKILVQGVEYDRLQLWSIDEYFQKQLPPMPLMKNPYTGKPMDPNFTMF